MQTNAAGAREGFILVSQPRLVKLPIVALTTRYLARSAEVVAKGRVLEKITLNRVMLHNQLGAGIISDPGRPGTIGGVPAGYHHGIELGSVCDAAECSLERRP